MRRLVLLVVLVTARLARADACPPAVVLTGDDVAVHAVRDELGARGIASAAPHCPVVRARIERRGAVLVVGTDGPGGVPIERTVTGAATAATVIESWTRSDVSAPLLERRAVPRAPAARELEPAVVAVAPPTPSGIQLFAAFETSFASDGTVWDGLQLGACIKLGPICAATRLHGGKVVSWPSGMDGFSRKGAELYAGIDVPLAIGRTRLTLGFAAGYGNWFTRHRGDGENMALEMGGPRAEVHAAFAYPLTRRLALDISVTASLAQATRTEAHGDAAADPMVVFPDEPRGLLRFAVGIRYGAL